MKKLMTILLCMLLIAAAVACKAPADKPETPTEPSQEAEAGENPDDEPIELPELPFPDEPSDESPEIMTGGWAAAEDPAITEERKAVFAKALEGLAGVDYEPIACLGTQIVAGTNYCFLAKATVVYPDAKPKYVLVFIYEDLSGAAQIMNFADMPIIPNEFDGVEPITEEETLMGGWAYAEDPAITDEIKANLEKALAGLTGATYEPVANLATQVVAGMNRCLLCKVTPVVPNAISHYALVHLYEALDGSVEMLDVLDFDFGALCTYGA